MRLNNHYNTLRSRLLGWLLIPLLVLSIAHIANTYLETRRTSTELYDKMLVALALTISEYAIASEGDLLTGDLLELIRQATNDKLYYKVLGPNGSFVVGYEDMPAPKGGLKQINNHIELYDAEYLGRPVRVIAASIYSERPGFSGWSSTFVAQTLQDRNSYVMDAIIDNTQRLLILIIIVTALLSIGISLALRPLKQLQKVLDTRDIHDLTRLETAHLPREINTLAQTINNLFERLTNQIALSKRFLENASHQLRTPITALTLQCDFAVRRAESERDRDDALKIKQNADRVARLANQLLRLSYSESESWGNTRRERLDLATVARQGIDRFLQQKPHFTITTDLHPAPIQGNEQLLLELLANLLENACKYAGDRGDITVSTSTEGSNVILEIKDQGPGIPEELRQLVTERFFRAHKDEDGSGLGLAIVKEITLVHRGTMQITSGDNDQGTCIRCLFRCMSD